MAMVWCFKWRRWASFRAKESGCNCCPLMPSEEKKHPSSLRTMEMKRMKTTEEMSSPSLSEEFVFSPFCPHIILQQLDEMVFYMLGLGRRRFLCEIGSLLLQNGISCWNSCVNHSSISVGEENLPTNTPFY